MQSHSVKALLPFTQFLVFYEIKLIKKNILSWSTHNLCYNIKVQIQLQLFE